MFRKGHWMSWLWRRSRVVLVRAGSCPTVLLRLDIERFRTRPTIVGMETVRKPETQQKEGGRETADDDYGDDCGPRSGVGSTQVENTAREPNRDSGSSPSTASLSTSTSPSRRAQGKHRGESTGEAQGTVESGARPTPGTSAARRVQRTRRAALMSIETPVAAVRYGATAGLQV